MRTNLKLPLQAALVLTLGLGVVSCGRGTPNTPANTAPTITVNNPGAPLQVGATLQLTPTVTPEGATVSYASSNEAAATVSQSGLVTAVGTGTTIITVTATSGTQTATADVTVIVSANPVYPTLPTSIAFVLDATKAPSGFTGNSGAAYDPKVGYGWVSEATAGTANPTSENLAGNARTRATAGPTPEQTGLIHMQYKGTGGNNTPSAFEFNVPTGSYTVEVSVGDSEAGKGNTPYDSKHVINVEGTNAIPAFTPKAGDLFRKNTVTVQVTDGRLTIDAKGGTNTKLNYVKITAATATALKR